MKKVILVICMSLLINSCYAFDFSTVKEQAINSAFPKGTVINDKLNSNNLKQQKAEKEYAEKLMTPDYRLSIHYSLMREDKELYKEDQSEDLTIYASLMKYVNSKSKTVWDMSYINKAKKLFDEMANTESDKIPTAQEFEKKKIIIPDKDFDSVSDDLKTIIYMLNIY